MSGPRVFPDTGVLLAMIIFPRGRGGKPSLTGEVADLHETGAFKLIVSRVVVDELEELIDREFPQARPRVMDLLAPTADQWTRWPTPEEIAAVLPFTSDPEDAPIFAAALASRSNIVLSNDFRAYHSPLAKSFWQKNGFAVESLYGLLCLFGKGKRRPPSRS
jgi:predicted nucleic acid-binding protein